MTRLDRRRFLGAAIFDLEHDPGEQSDLASARPADVARMQARHEAWLAEMTR